jgi:hypothetical protein
VWNNPKGPQSTHLAGCEPAPVSAFLFEGTFMITHWIHFDRQAQEGDLRRMQIITTDELSLVDDLRGPFDKKEDALKVAESLIQNVAEKTLERLRTEKPRPFATFPTSSPTTEE